MRRSTAAVLTVAFATGAALALPVAPAHASTAVPADVTAQVDHHYGTFRAFSRSGTGTTKIALPAGTRSGVITVSATHADTEFDIEELSSSGTKVDLPVLATGPYAGTVAYGTDSWRAPVALRVVATGHWSVTFRPVSSAPALASSGHGDGVFLDWGAPKTRRFVSKGGDASCEVRETPLAQDRETILASSGGHAECNVTARLSKGPSVIQVNSGGNWTLR